MVGSADVSAGAAGAETFLGATRDGITIRTEQDWFDYSTDQTAGIVRKFSTLRRVFIALNVGQVTLQNLAYVFDLAKSNITGTGLATGTIQISDTRRGELSLTAVGSNGRGKTRTYTFPRSVFQGASEHALSREDPTLFSAEVEVLLTPSTNRWFSVRDA